MEYTPIHSRFWSDGWVRELNALDRYLFLYLLTNGRAKLTGIYELPLDLMASESGIDAKDLRLSMLQRLEPKIYYKEGWVIIINYPKHRIGGGHKYNQGVKANYEELPEKIRALSKSFGYPIDTLSIEYQRFPTILDKNKQYTGVANAPHFEVVEENARPKKEPGADKQYAEVCDWAEARRGFPFVARKSQYTALKKCKENDISITRLKDRWKELEGQAWRDGFDMWDVFKSFNKKA